MLALTRKPMETIVIGKNHEIEVTVISVLGNKVKLAINAPQEIPIYREEILERDRQPA